MNTNEKLKQQLEILIENLKKENIKKKKVNNFIIKHRKLTNKIKSIFKNM